MSFIHRVQLLIIVALGVTTPCLHAQTCDLQWLPGEGVSGPDNPVICAVAWDADGPGPQPVKVVMGGGFSSIGTVAAGNIAAYTPSTGAWEPLGTGTNGTILTLAIAPDGALLAGGHFTTAGGNAASYLARWDGQVWTPLGSGTNGFVEDLLTTSGGDVVACGQFSNAGGTPANQVALWRNGAWQAMGSGLGTGNNSVHALAQLPNGSVVAGGSFIMSGMPLSTVRVARWDGAAWSSLATTGSGEVWSLATLPNGDLIAGGAFADINGVPMLNVARWNGSSWSAMGPGLGTSSSVGIRTVFVRANGDILAAARTVAGAASIRRWDGSAWQYAFNPSGPTGSTSSLALAYVENGGDLYVGGNFLIGGSVNAHHAARWDGTNWHALASGWSSSTGFPVTYAAQRTTGGELLIGGVFSNLNGVAAPNIAHWNGGSWEALGGGVSGISSTCIRSIVELQSGDIAVAGRFAYAGAVQARHVARWNGTAWSPYPSLPEALSETNISAMTVMPNGDLVAGGTFGSVAAGPVRNIARWNGSAWTPLGNGIDGTVNALAVLPSGDLVAAGYFSEASGVIVNSVTRWSGSAWAPLGTGALQVHTGASVGFVFALTIDRNGELVAAGGFNRMGGVTADNIAGWDGSNWHALGAGVNSQVLALTRSTDGDIVAGGAFTTAGGLPAARLARWNGNAWSPVGSGTNNSVNTLTALPDGGLLAGGLFGTAGSQVSAIVARFDTPAGCPACDTIDFNHDSLFPDTQDITDFLNVFAGGVCSGQSPTDPPCNSDIDFNNDSLFPDTTDIGSLLSVFSGGACL